MRLRIAALVVALLSGTAQPMAHADVDYGVGSGAHVGVLPGAFGFAESGFGFLNGSICAPPNVCDPINYFNVGDFGGAMFGLQSLNDGEAKLDAWLHDTPGKKIAMGHSLGALVIYKWLRDHSFDRSAPPPSELSFITMAAPEHRPTGYAYSDPKGMFGYRRDQGLGIPPNTPYHVVDVCRQWDGWCYWIPGDDRSKKGQTALHIDYNKMDLNDPANQVSVAGNIVSVLVPTPGW